MTEPQEFDVFLCHNSCDKDEVKAVAQKLEQEGITTWLDKEKFKGGDEWKRKLYETLNTTKVAFIFIGKNGVGPWQYEEINRLHNRYVCTRYNPPEKRVKIVPVFLAEANANDVPDDLKYLSEDFHFVNSHETTKLIEIFPTDGRNNDKNGERIKSGNLIIQEAVKEEREDPNYSNQNSDGSSYYTSHSSSSPVLSDILSNRARGRGFVLLLTIVLCVIFVTISLKRYSDKDKDKKLDNLTQQELNCMVSLNISDSFLQRSEEERKAAYEECLNKY